MMQVFPASGGGGGVTDHGALTGLTDDDHTQYGLLAGRSGGQTLIGGTASGNNLTLQSTAHATKGKLLFGTSAYDEVNNRFGIRTASPAHPLHISGSPTAYLAYLEGTMNLGGGVDMSALRINPDVQPGANVSNVFGFDNVPSASPGVGVTITNYYGFRSAAITGSAAGAITTTYGGYFQAVYGTQKPTNAYGIFVDDVGAAGITDAIGIRVNKPKNATNNYYFEFDTADATAAGTYHGRLPVRYNGVLKYIHIFNA